MTSLTVLTTCAKVKYISTDKTVTISDSIRRIDRANTKKRD